MYVNKHEMVLFIHEIAVHRSIVGGPTKFIKKFFTEHLNS